VTGWHPDPPPFPTRRSSDLFRATGVWAVPSTVNVTVPERAPAPGATAFTAAVKVTVCPNTDGAAEELMAVTVSALLTAWLREEVMVRALVSPPDATATGWLP